MGLQVVSGRSLSAAGPKNRTLRKLIEVFLCSQIYVKLLDHIGRGLGRLYCSDTCLRFGLH